MKPKHSKLVPQQKKVLGKKGVKVISLFEEEVLGTLMLCTLEETEKVSNTFMIH